VVLITGGGSGIGAATGELVCAEGGNAMLIDANVESLANTTKTIVDQIPDALVAAFVADVARTSGAIRAVECALEEFGRIDVLVNNASMRNYSALAEATPAAP
jgi:2-hydroxycyclohexanecarboxyl-CoA dehydrogenase